MLGEMGLSIEAILHACDKLSAICQPGKCFRSGLGLGCSNAEQDRTTRDLVWPDVFDGSGSGAHIPGFFAGEIFEVDAVLANHASRIGVSADEEHVFPGSGEARPNHQAN
jgi:hypothetical protein